ncbi:uncharacterized protein LOC143287336 [Babylonia areolata]|uniref:uncharacterized protein LOC143287336 n=1 Tax=Babylonia areolata TaxID=304850 RepID=UPI003FD41918
MAQLSWFGVLGIFAAMLAFVLVTGPVDGLICYSCHLQPGRNHCTDSAQLATARKAFELEKAQNLTIDEYHGLTRKFSDYLSVCSQSMPYCVIESIVTAVQYKLMYRDCSDGSHFATQVKGTRLENLPPDNATHCAYVSDVGAQVCVSLCNTGDFCNGPSGSSASLVRIPLMKWVVQLTGCHCGGGIVLHVSAMAAVVVGVQRVFVFGVLGSL